MLKKIIVIFTLGFFLLPLNVFATSTLADSYGSANGDNMGAVGSATRPGIAQSFTAIDGDLLSVVLYLKKLGSPTGNAVVKIYAHTGTWGSTGLPTGSALATSDNLDVSTLTTSLEAKTFSFTGGEQITLTNGTHYVLALEYSGGVWASDLIRPSFNESTPSHGGNIIFNIVGTWTADASYDLIFYLYEDVTEEEPPAPPEYISSPIMCSQAILDADSCYQDNFNLIITAVVEAIAVGVLLGIMVGVIVKANK